jgi:hypothetical protein
MVAKNGKTQQELSAGNRRPGAKNGNDTSSSSSRE